MRRDKKAGLLLLSLTGKGIWYSSKVDEADLLCGIDSDDGCKRSSSVWISTSLTIPRTLSSGRNRPLMLLFLLNCRPLNEVGVFIFLAWMAVAVAAEEE